LNVVAVALIRQCFDPRQDARRVLPWDRVGYWYAHNRMVKQFVIDSSVAKHVEAVSKIETLRSKCTWLVSGSHCVAGLKSQAHFPTPHAKWLSRPTGYREHMLVSLATFRYI
jgi:hypothetical protein